MMAIIIRDITGIISLISIIIIVQHYISFYKITIKLLPQPRRYLCVETSQQDKFEVELKNKIRCETSDI